jgi:cysteine synthase A
MPLRSILDAIGCTPHVRLARLFPHANVWMKLERQNPGGSIKDRIALSMIEAAERDGSLRPGATIIEPTSGNTGVGLAMVCAVKGYKLLLVMPESMTIERRRIMAAYGATFELTPREKGMGGAIARAKELLAATPGAWMPQQFENPANIDVHLRTTVPEILADFPQGLDAIITGVGTGGHITACARALRSHYAGLKVFAVEPSASPVLSGGTPSPHPIQGIGAGFVPKNCDTSVLDGIVQVHKDEAFAFAQKLAKVEGILAGVSTGASLAAVAKKLGELPDTSTKGGPAIAKDARILTFNYDTGERYFSMEGLF